MQGDTASRSSPHFDGCPGEDDHDCDDHGDSENNFGGRVAFGHFPEAKDDHLGETDEDLD